VCIVTQSVEGVPGGEEGGRKEDVVRTFYKLEEEGLGRTLVLSGSKGTAQVICTSSSSSEASWL
jgi:hypothetical protein